MVINANASTVKSAAKRAGYLSSLTIRPGNTRSSEKAEGEWLDSNQCSVKIALMKYGVEDFVRELKSRYNNKRNGVRVGLKSAIPAKFTTAKVRRVGGKVQILLNR